MNTKKYSWPFLLALALHVSIVLLFILSTLLKISDNSGPPQPEIIQATIVEQPPEQPSAKAKPEPVTEQEPAPAPEVEQAAEMQKKAAAIAEAQAAKAKAAATKAA